MPESPAADPTARTVLEILARPDDGTLPSLTREELWTLSDSPVLAHAGDTAWWEALDAEERELVMQTAQRGLVARNLLVASATGDGLDVDPQVAVVLRGRSEPSWLAVLGQPADRDVQLVVSGIDLQADVTAAALVSARLAGIHLQRLVPPDEAVTVMSEWLLRDPPEAGTTTGRTVEILHPSRTSGVSDGAGRVEVSDGEDAVDTSGSTSGRRSRSSVWR